VQNAGGIGKSHQTNSGFSAQRTTRRFVRNALRLKLHGAPTALEDRADVEPLNGSPAESLLCALCLAK
jgi:hypothetical protein